MEVDPIIEKLLSVRGNKPGKQVDLKEDEIKFLIDKSLQIIKEQKMLVELEAPLHVCGDIHGQYYDLLRIFEHCGYPGDGGDCANFVSQCLVKGGGHPNLSGGRDICRGYPCGFEEPGAKKLADCLVSRGWTSKCGKLMKPPDYIKEGDVLVYHSGSCDNFSAHAVLVTKGGSNALITCHSNEKLDVSYTYMSNSKPYYQWIHFNG